MLFVRWSTWQWRLLHKHICKPDGKLLTFNFFLQVGLQWLPESTGIFLIDHQSYLDCLAFETPWNCDNFHWYNCCSRQTNATNCQVRLRSAKSLLLFRLPSLSTKLFSPRKWDANKMPRASLCDSVFHKATKCVKFHTTLMRNKPHLVQNVWGSIKCSLVRCGAIVPLIFNNASKC